MIIIIIIIIIIITIITIIIILLIIIIRAKDRVQIRRTELPVLNFVTSRIMYRPLRFIYRYWLEIRKKERESEREKY